MDVAGPDRRGIGDCLVDRRARIGLATGERRKAEFAGGGIAPNRYRIDIPAELAYGDSPPEGISTIRAGDALTYVVDVEGNRYLDFTVADLSMTMGYGPAPIVEAVAGQMVRGAHFLLPIQSFNSRSA